MIKMKFFRFFLICFITLVLINSVSGEPRIDSVSFDPNHIESGDEANIYIKFHESPVKRTVLAGAATINKTTRVTEENPNLFYKAKLIQADDLSEKYIIVKEGTRWVGHIFTGESWTSLFTIKVREDALPTNYKMEFRLIQADIDQNEKDIALVYTFEIPVQGIVKFEIGSESVLNIGVVNKVDVQVSNVGGGNARHLSVIMNSTNPFTVIQSSEIYLGDIIGTVTKNTSFDVSVNSEANPGAYNIPLELRYIDSNGTEVRINKNIGVMLKGEPDIGVTLESSDNFKPGSDGKVVLNVVNKGFTDAKFLTLKLGSSDSYTVTSIDSVYIGKLESDDSETKEFQIKINKNAPPGKIPLMVTLEYKSESEDITYTKEYKVDVQVFSDSEYNGKQQQPGTLSYLYRILILIPTLVVLYLVIWFIYKILGVITRYLDKRIFNR